MYDMNCGPTRLWSVHMDRILSIQATASAAVQSVVQQSLASRRWKAILAIGSAESALGVPCRLKSNGLGMGWNRVAWA